MSRAVGAKAYELNLGSAEAYEIVDKIANNELDHARPCGGRGEGVISKARITRLGVAALAALMLMAAGCGDDDDDTGAPAGADAGTEESADQSGGAGEQAVTDYVDYIGGKAGKADPNESTIYIGWLNQQGGQTEIGAAATDGADLAVKVVNEQLGGIGGHPVALKKCFIRNAEEEGTTCGQRLGNDKDVAAINVGGVAIGIQPFYSTIGGKKPVIVGVAVTPVDGVQDNATILFGDATHVLGPFGSYAKDVLDAQTAALVYPNIAGITDGAAALDKGLSDAGVEVKKVGYAQGQTDLIGPLTAAGAQSADIVIPYSDASGCVNQAKALEQLGITDAKKIVSAPLCLNPTVSEGLGGDYPIWTYAIASSLFGDQSDPGMKPYMEVTEQYGVKTAPDPWVIVSFASVLTTVKFLNELGPDALETQAIVDKARSFTGPVVLGAPELQCGKYEDAPAICNDRTQFFSYEGKNHFEKAADWLQPPG
jgi:branched-chain amino acid transport system substrate-binding protein